MPLDPLKYVDNKVTVKDEGSSQGSVKILDFTGAGVSTSVSGETATINIVGGIGGVDWGDVGGTLANQTDLQSALDGKAPSLGADDNYVTDAEKVKLSNLSGTNTGDQTSIVGITGTKAQFNTAVTDGDILYVGDVTTNATHTGEVTGSGALTVDKTAITGKTAVTAVGTDYVLISDTDDSGNLKKALVSDFGGAGGTPGGADTQVQYNDAGAFGAEAAFTYNKTTNTLTIGLENSTGIITAPTATTADTRGGQLNILSGEGLGTQRGGTLNVGAGGSGNTSALSGGLLNLYSGAGGATGAGGAIYLNAGAGGVTSGAGGDVNILGGDTSTASAGGSVYIYGGNSTSGTDGNVVLGNPGKVEIQKEGSSLSAIFDANSIATTSKTFTFPNTTGTIALTSDITGTNSGTNTGDQTITNASDATSHTVTLSASGGSVQLIEGTNITLTTGGTASAGTVTINASSSGGGITQGQALGLISNMVMI